MVEMRASRPEEVHRLQKIWRKAFGDSWEYIDYFFDRLYTPERMLVLAEDGEIMTMLALLPMTFVNQDGEPARMSYIYALATEPEGRGKGYGRLLLRYADHYAGQMGADCISTVPAEPSLHRFFGTVGFQECFSLRKVEFLRRDLAAVAPGDGIAPVPAAEYNALRRDLLRGLPYVDYDDALMAYQKGLSQMGAADLYRIEAGGVTGIAAVEYVDEETLLVKELLIDPRAMAAAVAQIAQVLPVLRYHVRTPAAWSGLPGSYIQPFAMVKWYDKAKAAAWNTDPNSYMGLAFD